MKSYALQPTDENIISTFKNNSIGRNGDIYNFITFLNNIEEGCSIALEGYWGSGKTFFVKQTKKAIEAFNPFSNMEAEERKMFTDNYCFIRENSFDENSLINQVPIYYDAWMNDNDDDPILSLVCTILEEFDSDFVFGDVNFNAASLKNMINGVLSLTPLIIRIPEIIDTEDWLKQIKTNHEIHDTVERFLDSLLAERGDRLIIFVDELDRCSPAYAVRFLERIKHYFTNDRITFVFSVNINQLQHTIKNYYGQGFEAERYLDRFFDYRLDIPKFNEQSFYKSVGISDDSHWINILTKNVCQYFSFEMREIAKYSQMIKMISENSIIRLSGFDSNIHYAILIFGPLMLGLKISDSKKYKEFTEGKAFDIVEKFFSSGNNSSYPHLFNRFLNEDESFAINTNGDNTKKQVSVVTIAQRLYEYIFATKYSRSIMYKTSGEVSYSEKDKYEVMKKLSLICGDTYFEPKEKVERQEK